MAAGAGVAEVNEPGLTEVDECGEDLGRGTWGARGIDVKEMWGEAKRLIYESRHTLDENDDDNCVIYKAES